LACFVTVFLLSGPVFCVGQGKLPGERRVLNGERAKTSTCALPWSSRMLAAMVKPIVIYLIYLEGLSTYLDLNVFLYI